MANCQVRVDSSPRKEKRTPDYFNPSERHMPSPDIIPPRRRSRTLAQELVATLEERIRDGRLQPGSKLPTEAEVMAEYGISRTVVREAISRLQAAGLVSTRHGVGTFVAEGIDEPSFSIRPAQISTLQEVIAVLELRIGLETEAAALAAQRRTQAQLLTMRQALDLMAEAIERGGDAVSADFRFHLEVAHATQNHHYSQFMKTLGRQLIPRARLDEGSDEAKAQRQVFLRRVNAEHESILNALIDGDPEAARAAMRIHLSNSRERRRRSLVAGFSAASDDTRD